jgi:bacterioferritin
MDFNKLFGKTRNIKASEVPMSLLPSTNLTKEGFIALLNEDLALEYTAALQYLQHYAVMQGAAFDSIRVHLKDHANEEIAHAVTLADRITKMGGNPVVTINALKASPEAMVMLKQNLEDENTAVARYKERTMQAMALGEFGAADELMSILREEEEHAQDLVTSIGNTTVPSTTPEVSIEVEVSKEKVPGHPAAGPSYDSDNPIIQALQNSREQRKQEVLTKLANLKKA